MWLVYDIKYKVNKKKKLPSQFVVDLKKFSWHDKIPVGLGNLNSKLYRAIKEITGCEATSCKADVIKYKIVAY